MVRKSQIEPPKKLNVKYQVMSFNYLVNQINLTGTHSMSIFSFEKDKQVLITRVYSKITFLKAKEFIFYSKIGIGFHLYIKYQTFVNKES